MAAVPRLENLVGGRAVGSGGRPGHQLRQMGAVYTPEVLARWVASLVRDHSATPIRSVLDPACGDGALLAAARAELSSVQRLVGIDLSESAARSAHDAWPGRVHTLVADTLRLSGDELPQVDAVLMNPPWGAEVGVPRRELRESGFELASGQYDSWDLFVEWTVRTLHAGTPVAAIVPDALFLPEHLATRRLLLERTTLHVVARLGEGWFDGVFRGVAVLAYTIGRTAADVLRCIRLPHDARRRVLAGDNDLQAEIALHQTTARQSAWASDTEARFLLAASQRAAQRIKAIEARGGPWQEWVIAGRGAEIGRSGHLVRCATCGRHRPPPHRRITACSSCGNSTSWDAVRATSVQRPDQEGRWVPLIVGEDVRRYSAQASRWLRLGLDGVQYKSDAIYAAPKLLVRKTGLGLNAAHDTTGSFTTQVVYHFLARSTAPAFFLSYLEGLLCSRVLLALHLVRTGETEWRSHPYVTPKMLAMLPIPTPAPANANWRQAKAIAEAVERVHSVSDKNRPQAEATVDRLVAGLFGLDVDGCAWVQSVLAQTQALRAFSHTRSAGLLRPEIAA